MSRGLGLVLSSAPWLNWYALVSLAVVVSKVSMAAAQLQSSQPQSTSSSPMPTPTSPTGDLTAPTGSNSSSDSNSTNSPTTTEPNIRKTLLDLLHDPDWNFGHKPIEYGKETLEMKLRTRIAQVTIPMALIAIFASFIGFFICLVCPTCILKRLRARKLRRGYKRKPLVIRVAPNPPPLQQPATAETSISSGGSSQGSTSNTHTRRKVSFGATETIVQVEKAGHAHAMSSVVSQPELEEVYEEKGEEFDEVELNDLGTGGTGSGSGAPTLGGVAPKCVIIIDGGDDEVVTSNSYYDCDRDAEKESSESSPSAETADLVSNSGEGDGSETTPLIRKEDKK